MLQPGDVFAGYLIKRVLGQGGMGTVYQAKHPRLPRMTALKLLKRELYTDVEIRRRFEREADLAAGLDHPNIVTVFDRGAEDQQLWISMQYVPGADVSCADVNVLAPGRAAQIIADTAAALDFAHAHRVLHRDVKPANILLAKAPIGQPERVLLTDFGIAALRGSDTTLASARTITATLAYAPPELLTGLPLDDRADQYSLACTLFWMLTGSVPFTGATPLAVVNQHLYSPVPSLRRTRPALPPSLDRVLARAMAKRAGDRFGSCTEFAATFRHALDDMHRYQPNGTPAQSAHPAPRQHTTPQQHSSAQQHPTPQQQNSAPPHSAHQDSAPQHHSTSQQHPGPQQHPTPPQHSASQQHPASQHPAARQRSAPQHHSPQQRPVPQQHMAPQPSTAQQRSTPQNSTPQQNSAPQHNSTPQQHPAPPQHSMPQHPAEQHSAPQQHPAPQDSTAHTGPQQSGAQEEATGQPVPVSGARRTGRPKIIALPDFPVRSGFNARRGHPPPDPRPPP
ncbi:protein kinase [Nocardia sp. NPDC052566]|uniref:serine/threonine-protein kinase n=1 Tax=Nocardia sp. NPDC052566 TaxID=3364330 RepID=UPI0037C75A21